MTTASGEKPLELSVRNFGPIAEADIELRPLTVFVGPSNTGKSYLATLIYALHRFFVGSPMNVFLRGMPGQMSAHDISSLVMQRKIDLSESDLDTVRSWGSSDWYQTLTAISQLEVMPYESELPLDVAEVVRKVLRSSRHLSQNLDDEVVRCFGLDKSQQLVRYPGDVNSELTITCIASNVVRQTGKFRYDVAFTTQGASLEATITEAMPIKIKRDVRHPLSASLPQDTYDDHEMWPRLILAELSGNALASSVGSLGRPAHYLPSDRAGVTHSSRMIFGNLAYDASRRYFHPDSPRSPVLTGVIGDFLERLVVLASASEPREGNAFVTDLEQSVLGGSVRVEQSQMDYPTIVYRPDNWQHDLPLTHTSSMVSELAPVVLYLRHVVQPGDTLIIEEPESALHPAMQVELTRLLAAAVKAGIRIIITTHSEWILEELANLVLMSELPVEQRHGFEGADLALSPDEVGAWLFEPDESLDGGTVVREIPLDKEIGNFDSGFGLITTDLYNRYARISNRIERLKEG